MDVDIALKVAAAATLFRSEWACAAVRAAGTVRHRLTTMQAE